MHETNLADDVQIRALAHEGGGNEVNVAGNGPVLDVVNVLLGQGGQVHNDTRQVDVLALTVGNAPARQDSIHRGTLRN